MWDITYPILVMKDTQIITVNVEKSPLWALGVCGGSGGWIQEIGSHRLPVITQKACGYSAGPLTRKRVIAGKNNCFSQRISSLNLVPWVASAFHYFLVSPHFFSCCLWKGFLLCDFILYLKWGQQESQSWNTDMTLLTSPGPLSVWDNSAQAPTVLIIFCIPETAFSHIRCLMQF